MQTQFAGASWHWQPPLHLLAWGSYQSTAQQAKVAVLSPQHSPAEGGVPKPG